MQNVIREKLQFGDSVHTLLVPYEERKGDG